MVIYTEPEQFLISRHSLERNPESRNGNRSKGSAWQHGITFGPHHFLEDFDQREDYTKNEFLAINCQVRIS